MSICQPNNVSRVNVNVLYSIWSLYLLFLFNLILILFKIDQFCPENVTKFNFYIKVIMI